jgi:hypothetical protein
MALNSRRIVSLRSNKGSTQPERQTCLLADCVIATAATR